MDARGRWSKGERLPSHFAAQPDVVHGLTQLANNLEHARCDGMDRYDLVHDRVLQGRQLRKLTAQIVTIEPISPKRGQGPKLARVERPARVRREDPAQLSLLGCTP